MLQDESDLKNPAHVTSRYNILLIKILFLIYCGPGPELDPLVHTESCCLSEDTMKCDGHSFKVQSDKSLLLCVCASLHEPDEKPALYCLKGLELWFYTVAASLCLSAGRFKTL